MSPHKGVSLPYKMPGSRSYILVEEISTLGRKLGNKYWVVRCVSSFRKKVSISGIVQSVHVRIGYDNFHLLNLQRLYV